MKRIMTFYGAIIMIMFFPRLSMAQDLVVEGKAKIVVMDESNTAENVVVLLPDGTLGVRQVSSLSGGIGNYGMVVNPVTGKVWLDRNLGATQVATSSTDAASYGDIFQWGRGVDGHQLRTSGTTTTKATNWMSGTIGGAWNGLFITTGADWLVTANADLWSGTAAENNTCPSGFRVPTNAEWEQERRTWSSNDAAGAFASPLKLPKAGLRVASSGSLSDVGSGGLYWSSSPIETHSRLLNFNNSNAIVSSSNRATGATVRCIKN